MESTFSNQLPPEVLTSLQQQLDEFEAQRKVAYKKYIAYGYFHKLFKVFMVLGVIMAIVASLLPFLWAVTIPFIVLGVAALFLDNHFYTKVFGAPDERMKTKFKTEIVPAAMKLCNETFVFDHKKMIDEKVVREALIFDSEIINYQGEDYVSGTLQGTSVEFCELTIHKQVFSMGALGGDLLGSVFESDDVVADSGSNGPGVGHKLQEMFHGVLFVVDFHRTFKGSMIVFSTQEKEFRFFEKTTHYQRKLVPLTMPYKNRFEVYCNDDTLTNHLLESAQLLDKFIWIEDTHQVKVHASFIRGKMHLGINWKRDLFECDFAKGVPSIEDFKKIMEDIQLLETIVLSLNKEEKIWERDSVSLG